jgi:hypothetical protein
MRRPTCTARTELRNTPQETASSFMVMQSAAFEGTYMLDSVSDKHPNEGRSRSSSFSL